MAQTGPMPNSILSRTEQCLQNIERHDARLRAFISVMADDARKRAHELEARLEAGDAAGPLAGCVIAIKDNIDTAGQRTTLGSGFHAERIAHDDAEVVRRLRRAGAILIGKTNLHELAFGATTQNPHYGSCRNPWHPETIAGGSSGGSAVAVAADMCDAALGTDTGGSIRIPAALTGIVGLRPTVGRISNRGIEPVAPQLDTVGPMARTVVEAARLYEAIAGYDPEDEFSVDRPVESWCNALPRGLGGLRIGTPGLSFFDGVDAEVAKAVHRATKTLADLGAELRTVDIGDAPDLHNRLKLLVPTNVAARHRERLAKAPDTFGPDVRERMSLGLKTTGTDYADWLRLIERWCMRVRGLLESVDVILTPTVGIPAPKASAAADMISTTSQLTRLTFVWSYAGVPALSVPCGFTSAALPVGVQLIGQCWSEARLLAIGAAYQEATDFHDRRPPEFS
jgi:aspartyl-tRNA(Asn)/glutamyl-tRNA(Gln) amidotransferase subunit A